MAQAESKSTEKGEQYDNPERDELWKYISEDEYLTPEEKETSINLTKPETQFGIYTEEGGLMRRLLQHPNFDCETLRITTKDSWGKRVDPDDFEGGVITGVDGWLPIGVLTIGTSTRSTSSHAEIVSERVLDGE